MTASTATVRAWFDQHGWQLDPAALRAALQERGADEDQVIDLIDEGAERRRAAPTPPAAEPAANGSRPEPLAAASTGGGVPPQNLEAEEAVLGAVMVAPGALTAASEILSPDGGQFYRPSHGVIWRAVLALFAKGEGVDAITLTRELEETKMLEKAGGRVRLHELAALVPATANVAHYAQIVREAALLRDLIEAGGEIAKLGWAAAGEPAELVDQAQELVYRLTPRTDRATTEQAGPALKQTFSRMAELAESGGSVVGVCSGFHDLDRLTSGFETGNLVILAARPGMGKSSLALAIAANIANSGAATAVFSLEMSKRELTQRLLARQAHVDLKKIRAPGRGLGQDEWSRLANAAGALEKTPLYLNDRRGLTLLELRSELRRLKTRRPDLALAVIDYLQLMVAVAENRTQEITKISQGLKAIAGDLDVPILALSQLNRAVEHRTDKRPQLSDLRESGSVEQDGDLVAFIYRDGYYNPDTADENLAEVNLAKHRNGPSGLAKLAWVPEHATFTDLHIPGVMS